MWTDRHVLTIGLLLACSAAPTWAQDYQVGDPKSPANAKLLDREETWLTRSTKSFESHDGTVTSLAASADGRWLLSGGDTTARLWDLESDSKKPHKILEGHEDSILSVAISPDGTRAVTGDKSGKARVWDLRAGTSILLELNVETQPKRYVRHLKMNCVAISPDHRWVVTGCELARAALWDISAEDPTKSVKLLQNPYGSFAATSSKRHVPWLNISPDGRWLVTGGKTEARLWDLKAEDPAASPIALKPNTKTNSVAFSMDSSRVITGCESEAVAWDLTANDPSENPTLLPGNGSQGVVAVLSANGHRAVTGNATLKYEMLSGMKPAENDIVESLWDLNSTSTPPTRSVLYKRKLDVGPSHGANSPDGRLAAFGGDEFIRIYNMRDASPQKSRVTIHNQSGIASMLFIDANQLVVGDYDGWIQLWKLNDSIDGRGKIN